MLLQQLLVSFTSHAILSMHKVSFKINFITVPIPKVKNFSIFKRIYNNDNEYKYWSLLLVMFNIIYLEATLSYHNSC